MKGKMDLTIKDSVDHSQCDSVTGNGGGRYILKIREDRNHDELLNFESDQQDHREKYSSASVLPSVHH
jgi:hypothetical protein